MILHTQWNTTLITDAATGVEMFCSLQQIQTMVKPHFCPLPCQFLTLVINPVWGRLLRIMICKGRVGGMRVPEKFIWELCFGLLVTLFQVGLSLLGISLWSILKCMQLERKGVYVQYRSGCAWFCGWVFHDFELLRWCVLMIQFLVLL